MADLATYIGVGASIVGGFTATVIGVYFMDCFSRPYERRRQIALTARREATEKVRLQVIEKLFPPKKYDEVAATEADEESPDGEDEGETCAICLQPFKQDEEIVEGYECDHKFHRTCAMEWLHKHNDCPVCRKSMWTVDAFVKAKTKVLKENPAALAEEMEAVRAEEEAERQAREGLMVETGAASTTQQAGQSASSTTQSDGSQNQRRPARPTSATQTRQVRPVSQSQQRAATPNTRRQASQTRSSSQTSGSQPRQQQQTRPRPQQSRPQANQTRSAGSSQTRQQQQSRPNPSQASRQANRRSVAEQNVRREA